jgi:hypothetical protein
VLRSGVVLPESPWRLRSIASTMVDQPFRHG